MKIVIFGSTGATGKELVKQSLQKGHIVTAFLRNPNKLQINHKNLKICKGDVANIDDVKKALKGQDVVLSCLGTKPPQKPICFIGTKNIIQALKYYKLKRIVVESAYGASHTAKKGIYAKLLWIIIRPLLKDKEEMEKLLSDSDLNWTVVQPTILTNGPYTGKYFFAKDLKVRGLPKISRADVADFMLKVAQNNDFIKEVVVLSN